MPASGCRKKPRNPKANRAPGHRPRRARECQPPADEKTQGIPKPTEHQPVPIRDRALANKTSTKRIINVRRRKVVAFDEPLPAGLKATPNPAPNTLQQPSAHAKNGRKIERSKHPCVQNPARRCAHQPQGRAAPKAKENQPKSPGMFQILGCIGMLPHSIIAAICFLTELQQVFFAQAAQQGQRRQEQEKDHAQNDV